MIEDKENGRPSRHKTSYSVALTVRTSSLSDLFFFFFFEFDGPTPLRRLIEDVEFKFFHYETVNDSFRFRRGYLFYLQFRVFI